MTKQLMMDGLDGIRYRLDELAQSLPGFQFTMGPQPDEHDLDAIRIEGYCPELKKHAGVSIRSGQIASGEWKEVIDRMEKALGRLYDD